MSSRRKKLALKDLSLKKSLNKIKGSCHSPLFTHTVAVEGQSFTAIGESKTEAKHAAAKGLYEILKQKQFGKSQPSNRSKKNLTNRSNNSPMELLQKNCSKLGWIPNYTLMKTKYSPSARLFVYVYKVEVQVIESSTGIGSSMEEAKNLAAKNMLEALKKKGIALESDNTKRSLSAFDKQKIKYSSRHAEEGETAIENRLKVTNRNKEMNNPKTIGKYKKTAGNYKNRFGREIKTPSRFRQNRMQDS